MLILVYKQSPSSSLYCFYAVGKQQICTLHLLIWYVGLCVTESCACFNLLSPLWHTAVSKYILYCVQKSELVVYNTFCWLSWLNSLHGCNLFYTDIVISAGLARYLNGQARHISPGPPIGVGPEWEYNKLISTH